MGSKRLTPTRVGKMASKCLLLLLFYILPYVACVFAMRDGSKTDFSGIGTGSIFFGLSMSLKGTSLFGGISPYLRSFNTKITKPVFVLYFPLQSRLGGHK